MNDPFALNPNVNFLLEMNNNPHINSPPNMVPVGSLNIPLFEPPYVPPLKMDIPKYEPIKFEPIKIERPLYVPPVYVPPKIEMPIIKPWDKYKY